MKKPNFHPGDIPPWARWAAMDADGAWWCYEVEPLQQEHGWYENEVGRCQRLRIGPPLEDWRSSLIRLPD